MVKLSEAQLKVYNFVKKLATCSNCESIDIFDKIGNNPKDSKAGIGYILNGKYLEVSLNRKTLYALLQKEVFVINKISNSTGKYKAKRSFSLKEDVSNSKYKQLNLLGEADSKKESLDKKYIYEQFLKLGDFEYGAIVEDSVKEMIDSLIKLAISETLGENWYKNYLLSYYKELEQVLAKEYKKLMRNYTKYVEHGINLERKDKNMPNRVPLYTVQNKQLEIEESLWIREGMLNVIRDMIFPYLEK